MTGGITFGGLGSGLDTGAIIDALLNVERVPIQQLENRKGVEKEKLDLLGTLKGHVQSLRDSAKDLSTFEGFLGFTVTAADPDVATFTADGNAVSGSHDIAVETLAAADRWAFDGVTDADAQLSAGNISFTADGQAYDVTVNAGQASLNQIAAEINSQATDAVTASVVNTGTDSNPSYQLVVSSNETGEDFNLTSLTSTVSGLTVDGTPGGTNNIVQGSNAVAYIDGLRVERSDNQFDDVLEGVTISILKETGVSSPTSFTVEPDKDEIKKNLKSFVDAYNRVVDFVNKQNTYDEEEGPGGELFGDSILRSVRNVMTDTLFGQTIQDVQADTAGFGTLRLIGVEVANDGKLSIDDDTLDEKLDEDLNAVADLFVDSDGFDNGGAVPGDPDFYVDSSADSGLADDLVRAIDRVLKGTQGAGGKFSKGLFDARTEAINRSIKQFNDRIEDREFRLARYEENLVSRFTALETVMAQLQSQSSFLASI